MWGETIHNMRDPWGRFNRYLGRDPRSASKPLSIWILQELKSEDRATGNHGTLLWFLFVFPLVRGSQVQRKESTRLKGWEKACAHWLSGETRNARPALRVMHSLGSPAQAGVAVTRPDTSTPGGLVPEPNGEYRARRQMPGRGEGDPPGGEEKEQALSPPSRETKERPLPTWEQCPRVDRLQVKGGRDPSRLSQPQACQREAQRGHLTHPRSHRKLMAEAQNGNPGLPPSRDHTLSGPARISLSAKTVRSTGQGLLTSTIGPGEVPPTPSSVSQARNR